MLAKIVQPWPRFFFFGAIVAKTPVYFAESMRRMDFVYTFLMSLKIIDGTETLVFPTAIRFLALEWLFMAGDIFATSHA